LLQRIRPGGFRLAPVGVLLSLLGCEPSVQGSPAAVEQRQTVGGLGLALTFPGGMQVSTVHYEVLDTTTGQVVAAAALDVASRSSVMISLSLPVGTYLMHVTTTGESPCEGTSQPFSIVPGQDSKVPLTLNCGTPLVIDTNVVTFNGSFAPPAACGITQLTVTRSAPGTDVALMAKAGPGASFAWTTSDPAIGALGTAASGNAFFTCSTAGTASVTLTVFDAADPTCSDSRSVGIVCPAATLCGNGVVDPGEQCDGDAGCNLLCTRVGCGNGVVDVAPVCGT
jgi:hypothetical protein